MSIESKNVPLQIVNDSTTQKYGINLYILRTDLNHPTISGNKLYKLKYNLQEAQQKNKDTLLTFGGAFSNHIAATAATGKELGFKTIGIIRGEKHEKLNPTLAFAQDCGMHIHYVSRGLFRDKTELLKQVKKHFGKENIYTIPEGGSNELGIKGCTEIRNSISIPFDYICSPCGTGATITGIIQSLNEHEKALGFQVLKGESYIKNEVEKWLNKTNIDPIRKTNWTINEDYHFGAYAKVNESLRNFIKTFEDTNNIPLDYVYTGKMMFGIYELIKKNRFPKNCTIIAVHTGGLQGNAGFEF